MTDYIYIYIYISNTAFEGLKQIYALLNSEQNNALKRCQKVSVITNLVTLGMGRMVVRVTRTPLIPHTFTNYSYSDNRRIPLALFPAK